MCRKILIELLERRVHLNILNNDKWGPIHIAVRKGQNEAIRLIFDRLK